MPFPPHYSFVRYLLAKKSLDDRSLNQRLWQRLPSLLRETSPARPLRILEVGGGIGSMATRLFEAGYVKHAAYTLVDSASDTVETVGAYLSAWASATRVELHTRPGPEFEIGRPGQTLSIRPVAADIDSFSQQEGYRRGFDLLLAHAFLDLLNLQAAVPTLLASLVSGGAFYFTLNFDGLTAFEPVIDADLDRRLIEAYHQSMDERLVNGSPSGDRYTGRRLLHVLKVAGAQEVDAGSSDWMVWPTRQTYPEDESYFLHFIIETINATLMRAGAISPGDLDRWVQHRHAQIDRGELFFIAHQIDYLGLV